MKKPKPPRIPTYSQVQPFSILEKTKESERTKSARHEAATAQNLGTTLAKNSGAGRWDKSDSSNAELFVENKRTEKDQFSLTVKLLVETSRKAFEAGGKMPVIALQFDAMPEGLTKRYVVITEDDFKKIYCG